MIISTSLYSTKYEVYGRRRKEKISRICEIPRSIVLEIAPKFYVTWDDSKIKSNPNPLV
jgi:hypothetical protein